MKEIREKAFEFAQAIIDKTGPRLAGSVSAIAAADLLNEQMSTYADQVEVQKFNLYQGAFLGWIRILVGSYLIAIWFLWYDMPLISLALGVLSILILVLQFFFYLPIIDWLYPKKSGYNVIGTVEPKGEVKSQVIISGHHDSAKVFNFFIHQPKLYNLRVTGSIVFVVMLCVLALLSHFIKVEIFGLIVKIILSGGILIIIQMWFFASKKVSIGAGDNLIASTMAVEIGRYFSQNRLNNTRVIIASFDAEEEGLRGARAFAKKYQSSFEQHPTTLLNTDCAYNLKDMFFLTSDINNTVSLDQKLADDLVAIAKGKGYETSAKPLAFLTGGTDAGELAKKGVKATTLIGMPWSNNTRSSVYHTPNDTLKHVEKEIIDASIEIFIEYIENNDK